MTKPESYEELVNRIAYVNMNGIAKGTPAVDLAAYAVNVVLMWKQNCVEYDKGQKNAK